MMLFVMLLNGSIIANAAILLWRHLHRQIELVMMLLFYNLLCKHLRRQIELAMMLLFYCGGIFVAKLNWRRCCYFIV